MVSLPSRIGIDYIKMIKLAREIAMEILPLESILAQHNITTEDFEELKLLPTFSRLLEGEMVAWQSAANTHERVKLKSAAVIEEWLPELNNRIHDGQEALPAKIEAGKLLAKLAGMGLSQADVAGIADRFTVTINIGAEKKHFEKELPPKVIDAEFRRDDHQASEPPSE